MKCVHCGKTHAEGHNQPCVTRTQHEWLGDDLTVSITQKRLTELENYERLAIALQNGGVDNWDGYSFSLEDAGINGNGEPDDGEDEDVEDDESEV